MASMTDLSRHPFRIILTVLLAVLLLVPGVSALAAEPGYANGETGYEAYIIDEADLLTSEEEAKLLEKMKPITQYGGVMFLSMSDYVYNSQNYAMDVYRQYFGQDSGTVFFIDMYNRNIWIFSDGAIYRTVTKAYANTITDNVYTYASSQDYYSCAAKAFEQEYTILEGGRIAQPMKYLSNAFLALVAASLITFLVLRFDRARVTSTRSSAQNHVTVQILNNHLLESHIVTHDSSSGGGGGGRGGGGGGGGGGHSGGGGGHSF